MSISAVVFDFGSTLIRETGFSPEEAHGFLVSRAVLPDRVRQQDLQQFEEKVFRDMLERRERSGLDFLLTQYLDLVQACLGVRFSGEPDETAFRCWLLEYQPKLEKGALECLKELRNRGAKIGLLSNTILPRSSVQLALEHFGVLDYFDAVVCSSEVGYRKPNELIYRAILGRLQATPEQCAMVGDNLELDIAGAASVGMTTVWYNPGNVPGSGIKPDHIVVELASVPRVLGLG